MAVTGGEFTVASPDDRSLGGSGPDTEVDVSYYMFLLRITQTIQCSSVSVWKLVAH